MKSVIYIKGLDCPNCALELEEEIRKIDGVISAQVEFINQKIHIEVTNEKILLDVKNICNNFEEVKVIENNWNVLKIENLDCPNCAKELEEEISKINGIDEVEVDFINQKVRFRTNEKMLIENVKFTCNHFEEVKVVEEKTQNIISKKDLICNIIAIVVFVIGLVISKIYSFEYIDYNVDNDKLVPYIISLALFFSSYILVAYPIFISTFKNIIKGRIFDENFLMSIASIGAICIGEITEGVLVILLYQIGELLQSIAVNSSRNSITSLMELKAEKANLLIDDDIREVIPDELNIDDLIVIKNGEKVPVDCVIIEGKTSFDTKSLTGESLLKEASVGDEILSGYINFGAVIKAKVIRKYSDSTVSKILELVEDSSAKKAKPEKFITKFARYYTPIVCIVAFIIGGIIPLIISLFDGNWSINYSDWIYRALTLLVISCPCALIISVPLTYFGGVGTLAKHGVLVKGTTYLDILSKVDIVAFDKTGTLTKGDFSIINVNGDEKTLKIAAAAEKGSNHPIAHCFDSIETEYIADDIIEVAGQGIVFKIDDEICLVGNASLLKEKNIKFNEIDSVSTIIYVCVNNELNGYIEIDDVLKEESQRALNKLKQLGIKKLVLLTGDNQKRALEVAKNLKIDEVYGNLLPSDKLNIAENLKKEGLVLYVGDGINDAPVMSCVDCSLSMGKMGSDVAIESSDIVLVNDSLENIYFAITKAKHTRKIVFQNIVFSIICKVIFMLLGILNLIPLSLAVFADVGVMLIAIMNSFRTRIVKKEINR